MAKQVVRIVLEVLSLIVLLGTIAFLIIYWNRIPAQVPMHFNGKGEFDGLRAKAMLLINPVIMAVIHVSLFFSKTIQFRSLGKSVRVPAPPLLFPAMKLAILAGIAYLTVCASLMHPVGAWFLPAFLALTFLPLLVSLILVLPTLNQYQ